MFAVSRFAHYLKCMVRDKIGSTKEKDQLERWLNKWITLYVDADPKNSSEEVKARKPLAAAPRSPWSRTRRTPAITPPTSSSGRISSSKGMDIGMSLVASLAEGKG